MPDKQEKHDQPAAASKINPGARKEILAHFEAIRLVPPPEVKDLGEPVALYRTPDTSVLVRILVIITGGAMCLASIYLVIAYWEAAILIGILFLAGVLLIAVGILDRKMSVVVYRGGLVDIHGKTMTVIPWEDIAKVWESITETYASGIYVNTNYRYTLELAEGETIYFTNAFQGIETLGAMIQAGVTEVLLPSMTEAYNAGESLEFGPIVLDQAGLSYKASLADQTYTLRWTEIEAFKLERGQFEIRKKGKWLTWAKIKVASIPNLLVFLSLTDKILGVDTGAPVRSTRFW